MLIQHVASKAASENHSYCNSGSFMGKFVKFIIQTTKLVDLDGLPTLHLWRSPCWTASDCGDMQCRSYTRSKKWNKSHPDSIRSPVEVTASSRELLIWFNVSPLRWKSGGQKWLAVLEDETQEITRIVYQVKQGQMHSTQAIFKPWHLISWPKIAPLISAKHSGIVPRVKSTVSCVA